MKFEHLIMDVPVAQRLDIPDALDLAGKDGWELVTVVRCGDHILHYLKRPRQLIEPANSLGDHLQIKAPRN